MKTLYLDCGMGAAGDMLMAALLELHPDRAGFLARLNGLGIPGVEVRAYNMEKQGILGTHIAVTVHGQTEEDHGHGHEHGHTTAADIRALLERLDLPEGVRADAAAVYRLIAQAEGKVHGRDMEHIHFHEVGSLDAVADVVGVCLLMAELAPDRVLASPVHVGSGQVRCAHGLLPVPAPATAELLRGVPIYGGTIQGELCTPTGAALLRYFVDSFGPMPPLRPQSWGYGMGARDFEAANCLRAVLGEEGPEREAVWELACNLDDMTGEDIAFACETLLRAGALDVWTAAVGMKKGRPGTLLSCLCRPEDRERMTALLLCHTSTLGVRSHLWERTTLDRREETRPTPWGPVRFKRAEGRGVRREKPAFEDLADIARREDLPLEHLRSTLKHP